MPRAHQAGFSIRSLAGVGRSESVRCHRPGQALLVNGSVQQQQQRPTIKKREGYWRWTSVRVEFYVNENNVKERLQLYFFKNQSSIIESDCKEEECAKEPSSPEKGLELQTDSSPETTTPTSRLHWKKIKVYIL
ncbi:hypothetical protein TNCV_3527451 [Trichonephila clavipes]|nr:hypothetical protein TNCV_3527451 [Trichonephila clavipes]